MGRCITLLLLLFSSVLRAQSTGRILTPPQMQADLHLLYQAWTEVHPGIYRFNTPDELAARFRATEAACATPLPESRFFLLLSQLAQTVHCGHTYPNPLNQPDTIQQRLLAASVLPLFFEADAQKRLYITHNLSGIPALARGAEITAVNGIPTGRLVDSLLTVSRSDGRHARGKQLSNIGETPDEADAHSLFDTYTPLFFPPRTGGWTVSVRPPGGGKPATHALALVPRAERLARYERLYGPAPTGKRSWAYGRPTPETAYLKCGTFAFWDGSFDTHAYVDSAFADLRRHPGIRTLIVDIRGNEGGDNTGDYILSYLTARPIGCDDPDRPCYRCLRLPDPVRAHVTTWDASYKQPKDSALFFRNELGLYERRSGSGGCAHIAPRTDGFRGTVYLLIDAKNSSAGYEMARNFRTAGLGTLVGAPTGGCQQGINGGEFFFLTLPHSGIELDLPLIYNYHPGKADTGIQPDFEVEPTPASRAAGTDPVLEFVLQRAAQRR